IISEADVTNAEVKIYGTSATVTWTPSQLSTVINYIVSATPNTGIHSLAVSAQGEISNGVSGRKSASTANGVLSCTSTTTSCVIYGLLPGVTYTFAVTAVLKDGISHAVNATLTSASTPTPAPVTQGIPKPAFSFSVNGLSATSAVVSRSNLAAIARIAKYIVTNKVTAVVLNSYSDGTGTFKENAHATKVRATYIAIALKKALAALHKTNIKIYIVTHPVGGTIGSTKTKSGRNINRRVEIGVVLGATVKN
ncbi:MAG: fibronectin type III domain-containing protein, partial [Acidimicrobiaceae bacterium]